MLLACIFVVVCDLLVFTISWLSFCVKCLLHFFESFLCDVCHIVVGGLVGVPCCPVGSCATAGFGVYGG